MRVIGAFGMYLFKRRASFLRYCVTFYAENQIPHILTEVVEVQVEQQKHSRAGQEAIEKVEVVH